MTSRAAVPGWINKIRFIKYYIFNPCEAPFMLYIEMAREPAHRTALVFLEFDLFALVKRFFRPIGLRSRRHGRKGSRSGRYLKGVPEIADLVADVLPGRTEYSYRKYGTGTLLLYVISDTAERVAWNLALVELSTDFLYDTLLGVIKDDRARCPNLSRFARAQNGAIEGGAGPLWRPHNMPILHYVVNFATANGFACSNFLTDSIVVFAANISALALPVNVAIRLVNGSNPDEVWADSGFKSLAPDENADFIVEADIPRTAVCAWQIACEGGFCRVNISDVFGITID